MMAKKRLAVVVAMAAMAATTAVPAFAQQEAQEAIPPVGPAEGGQYAPAGETQQEALPPLAPAAGTAAGGEQYASQAAPQAGEEFAGVGVVESLGGGGRYGLRLGPLEGQELRGGFDFAAFEGETVRVSGRFAIDESRGRVLQVESIELAQEEGEQTTITGVFSVEEGGWSFVTDEKTGQDYYIVGIIGLDPQATAGKRVVAEGVAECGYDGPVYGCTLGVSSIKPVGEGAEQEAAPVEPAAPTEATDSDEQILPFEVTTVGDEAEEGTSPERQAETGADDEGAVVISGDTSYDKGGASGVDSKPGSAAKGSNAVLPATGGVLPIAGLAGLVIVGAGLVVRSEFDR